jgi:hypothetical protein
MLFIFNRYNEEMELEDAVHTAILTVSSLVVETYS